MSNLRDETAVGIWPRATVSDLFWAAGWSDPVHGRGRQALGLSLLHYFSPGQHRSSTHNWYF